MSTSEDKIPPCIKFAAILRRVKGCVAFRTTRQIRACRRIQNSQIINLTKARPAIRSDAKTCRIRTCLFLDIYSVILESISWSMTNAQTTNAQIAITFLSLERFQISKVRYNCLAESYQIRT